MFLSRFHNFCISGARSFYMLNNNITPKQLFSANKTLFFKSSSLWDNKSLVVKLEGLPYRVTTEEILNFLKGVNVVDGSNGVLINETKNGYRSGDCYVKVASQEDVVKALEKNNQYIGKRYIIVVESSPSEVSPYYRTKKSSSLLANLVANGVIGEKQNFGEHTVVMIGLPYSANEEDINKFFAPLKTKSVHIHFYQNKSTGIAHAEFESEADVYEALKKNKEYMGNRYIVLNRPIRHKSTEESSNQNKVADLA